MAQTCSSAGVLGSTGVTPLPRYYDPIRLLAKPRIGYEFPFPVAGHRAHDYQHFVRSLRFLSDLSMPAVSNHPGKLVSPQLFVFRRHDAGFTLFGGLAASIGLTRPN